MSINKFNDVVDRVQSGLVWFVLSIVTICTATLIAFDPLAGTGTLGFLASGDNLKGAVLSMATTGLLFALMFLGYMMKENKNTLVRQVGWVVLVASGLLYIQDIVFDSFLADILRYGAILSTLDDPRLDSLQWMFRFLVAGLSTVGEALAIVMLVGMPVLKTILKNALQSDTSSPRAPVQYQSQTRTTQNRTQRHEELRKKYQPQPAVDDDEDEEDDDDMPMIVPSPFRHAIR